MHILNLEGRYFVRSFRERGHRVLCIGQDPHDDLVLERTLGLKELLDFLDARGFVPDLVLWNDLCRPPAVLEIERLPSVVAGFSIDQYCNPWHVPFSAAFDLFLVAQKVFVPRFEEESFRRPCRWFPLFCDPHRDRDPGVERGVPVSFVGTLDPPMNPARRPFLEAFRALLPLETAQGDYAPLFSQCRIVLNQSVAAELNFRLFQAAGCGAAVLTEDVGNGLRDLFVPGEEILVYPRGDAQEASRVARDALADPPGLARLAEAGQRKVLADHTAGVRADRILAWAEELARGRAPRQRLQRQGFIRARLAEAFSSLAGDPSLPIPPEVRSGYKDVARAYGNPG